MPIYGFDIGNPEYYFIANVVTGSSVESSLLQVTRPPEGGACGDGIVQLINNEQCDDGAETDFCTDDCRLQPDAFSEGSIIVDFNGESGVSDDEWLKVGKVDYPGGEMSSGWITENIDGIILRESASVISADGIRRLLLDHHEFNSSFAFNLGTNATYDITYFIGGELSASSTGMMDIVLSDIEGDQAVELVYAILNGEMKVIQKKGVDLRQIANFTFTKYNSSELGVITGIVLDCVSTDELQGDGLDNDCDGEIDVLPSSVENRLKKEKEVIVILGVEKNGSGGWEDYVVRYNSSESLGRLIPFSPKTNEFPIWPGISNYYNTSRHLLQYYWKETGDFSIGTPGDYRIYLEMRNYNGSIINVRERYGSNMANRTYSNIFKVE